MVLFFDFCFMTFYFLILLFVLFFMIFGQAFWGLGCGRWESPKIIKNRTGEVAKSYENDFGPESLPYIY